MDTQHRPGGSTSTGIRLLGPDDAEAIGRMSTDAFGVPAGGSPPLPIPGQSRWGLFDRDTLAAKANDRAYESMIGGRPVPTAGVAGVVVAPEYRGRGLARRLMRHLLLGARERGAVIATLFRTAPALYRSLGFENVAELRTVEIPIAALGGLRAPRGVTLRRAGAADVPAARAIYRAVAATSSCLLSREGILFPGTDADWLAQPGQVTVAVDGDGDVVGYARWDRGAGWGPGAALSVTDLQALTGDAHAALLAMIGSFSAVTPVVRLRTSGTHPVGYLVPGAGWTVTDVRPYLLRVLDAAGAIAARGWPAGLRGSMTMAIDDPQLPWNSGLYRLEVGGGEARLASADAEFGSGSGHRAAAGDGAAGALTVHPRGLAVLYAGSVDPAALRRVDLLDGGSPADDEFLAAAFAGPQPAIMDFF